MSKKEKRRAARQAFPQAKASPTVRSRYDLPTGGGRSRKRSSTVKPGLKPPSLKRAAIQGVILAALYFVVIQWLWKSNAPVGANLLFSAAGFVFYTGVAYWLDRFKYQRALRKNKSSAK